MTTVYIALGSNINPEENIQACANMLREHWPSIRFSSVWKSKAMFHEEQDDFLNAAAEIETDQTPEQVHNVLQAIEAELKKNTPFEYGPRTIDLDLLLYGDHSQEHDELTIPHPRMHERRFVLAPLCELTDEEKWKELFNKTSDQLCEKTDITL